MVEGETLREYNGRVGLISPHMLGLGISEKMDMLDKMVDRKSSWPPTAMELWNEVADRRRLEGTRRNVEEIQAQIGSSSVTKTEKDVDISKFYPGKEETEVDEEA